MTDGVSGAEMDVSNECRHTMGGESVAHVRTGEDSIETDIFYKVSVHHTNCKSNEKNVKTKAHKPPFMMFGPFQKN